MTRLVVSASYSELSLLVLLWILSREKQGTPLIKGGLVRHSGWNHGLVQGGKWQEVSGSQTN